VRSHAGWLTLILLAAGAAHAAGTDLQIRVEDQKHDPVGDGVVWLVPLDRPAAPASAPPTRVEIEQRGQEFSPLVTVVRVGTTVQLPNRDNVEHHVYSQSQAKKFEFPLYAPGRAESVVFDRPGVVALGCNIHDWMLAYVVVVDTPWYSRTDAAGHGMIAGVPPGRYRAEVWHRRLASSVQREIEIETASTPLAFTLALKPDRRIRRPASIERGGYR